MTIREELDSLGFDWASGKIIHQRFVVGRGYVRSAIGPLDPVLDGELDSRNAIIASDSSFLYASGSDSDGCWCWIDKIAKDIDHYLAPENELPLP